MSVELQDIMSGKIFPTAWKTATVVKAIKQFLKWEDLFLVLILHILQVHFKCTFILATHMKVWIFIYEQLNVLHALEEAIN